LKYRFKASEEFWKNFHTLSAAQKASADMLGDFLRKTHLTHG